jgi:hypothetical protein
VSASIILADRGCGANCKPNCLVWAPMEEEEVCGPAATAKPAGHTEFGSSARLENEGLPRAAE